MVNAFKVYSHHRELQPGDTKPDELSLMQFSMRVAKTLCEEGVESKQRSPNKRRRGEEAAREGPAGRPVAECKLVDFTVAKESRSTSNGVESVHAILRRNDFGAAAVAATRRPIYAARPIRQRRCSFPYAMTPDASCVMRTIPEL